MKFRLRLKSMVSAALTVMTLPALSEPVVIYDNGRTRSLPAVPNKISVQIPSSSALKKSPTYFSGLPVSTVSMSPGRVEARVINRPDLTQPIFIVGADPMSLRWLETHRERLRQLNALGIAVNVETPQQLDQLRQVSGGVPVNPVAGDKIALQLGLAHYPVLVSSTHIEQ